ncbi:MAG: zinc ribbon domain-containing protein, partial [Lachnospiraceae bacterium]|nr:zinc ribbon domain-containing protein [Lachnospiraceae bacterium]
MICKECGAGLMETDQFCPKCGTRVIKEMRCPDCGAVLREGTKFCHKCGRLIGGGSGRKKTDEAEDISFDAMERNILSETAAEIKAGRNAEREPRRTSSAAGKPTRSSATKSASSRSGSEHAPSARSTSSRSASEHATASKSTSARSSEERTSPSKSASGRGTSAKSVLGHGSASGRHSSLPEPPRKNRKRIDYREDDWEEEDWEDEDDWDEDDEEGVDVITIMT